MQQDSRTDAELTAAVECYGRRWDPDEQVCTAECSVQARCVALLAKSTLPKLAVGLGKAVSALTTEELPEDDVSLSPKALEWLQRVSACPELGLPDRDAEGHLVPHGYVPDPPKRRGRPPKPRALANPPKAREAKAQAPRAKQASKSGEAGGRKPSVRASGPASRKAKHWGPHTYARRWMRERQRNPLIARIPVGQIIYRTWKGREYRVLCQEGCWLLNQQRYATLYAVVEAITGTRAYPAQIREGKRPEGSRRMAAWSAKRFFELETVVPRDLAGSAGPVGL